MGADCCGLPPARDHCVKAKNTVGGATDRSSCRREVELIAISRKTALKCLDGVSTGAGTATRSDGRAYDPLDPLSIDQLIDIARQRGLEAKLKHLEWRELQVAASTDAVLL